MKHRAITLLLLLACLAVTAGAQQNHRQQKEKYVVIPNDVTFVVIAHQPECPLHFDEAVVLAAMDGSETSGYTVRNTGTKPIRSFTVAVPGGTETWSEEFTKKLFMPGDKTPGDDNAEIVPLTDELRDKLKLKGPMRALVVFMIVHIEYADGTVYSAESTYKAFLKYGDELWEAWSTRKSQ